MIVETENRTGPIAAIILEDAASLIQQYGHVKGAFARNRDGVAVDPETAEAAGYCAMGAIFHAAEVIEGDANPDTQDRAMDALAFVVGLGMTDWNDHPDRTPSDVIGALRAAAENVRAGA